MNKLTFEWNESALKKAEEDYSRIEPSLEVRENIVFYAQMMAKHIPLSTIVLQGLINFAMKDWQLEYKKSFAEEARGPNALVAANQMNEFLNKRIIALLRSKDQAPLVENALKETIETFKQLGASGAQSK